MFAQQAHSAPARARAVRLRPRLRGALLLFAIASPALIHAQFQEPTSEELKMTVDPKAPGAAAVYLYQEDVTDDVDLFQTYYERIKVLTEKGKELATIQIPYRYGVDTVTDIQGRTIHADGTIVPLTAKPADLMDFKSKNSQLNIVTFTLPSVEVGSILEYRLKITLADNRVSAPNWNIQKRYFVHKAHYSFHPLMTYGEYITDSKGQNVTRLMCSARLAPGAKVKYDSNKYLYSLDLTDIPAAPEEDWMPPQNTIGWRVGFYYTYATSATNFWETAGKDWAKQAERFTNPSSPLKAAASQIVAASDSEEQKARKIYAEVMKLDNTRFSRKKSAAERKAEKLRAIKSADDVWTQQSGSEDEIALLFVALARAAGLKVWPMQVVDRSRAFFETRYLSSSQLDDYIAIVSLDGKEVYLDPGQKMCPFGSLNWKHTLASGFRLSDSGAVIGTTPAGTYQSAVFQRVASLNIDEQGNVQGTARIVMTGPDALYWRQLALENDSEEVKKQFNEEIRAYLPDGIQAEFDHFLSLDDYTVNLMALVKISGSLATATGKHFFLPGLFFESRARKPFVAQAPRLTPIDLHYARMEQDDVNYHLPSGFTVQSAPNSADLSWPAHASLKIDSTVNNGSVEVIRTFARNFAMLDPKDYNDLHDFYLKLATADQQQIVLTRSTAVKGN